MPEHDKDYEWVAPLAQGQAAHKVPKGRQCGECGMKFDSHVMMAYCCANMRCPMGWSATASAVTKLR